MSFMQDSGLGDVTRGGQLILHFFRMLGQVLRKFSFAMLGCAVLLAGVLFIGRNDSYSRYLALRYYMAQFQITLFRNEAQPTSIDRRDGSHIETTLGAIVNSPTVTRTSKEIVASGVGCLLFSGGAIVAAFVGIGAFIWRTGTVQRLERHMRGSWLVNDEEYRALLKREKLSSDLMLANIPLVKDVETGHILITGAPGCGKTAAIYQLLKRIRSRGERVICYSPSGDFIQAFYRHGRDTILNPFDERCPSWNLWDDCPHDYDHDMMAAAIVPDPIRMPDPFWHTAARSVIASLTQEMGLRGERSIPRMLELLALVPLADLHDYLKHTEGGAQLDPESEKPALSIRTTAVTYARALRYLPPGNSDFHIRQWVQAHDTDEWIFLNASDPQMTSVRPLLSMWLEILTNSLLSLPESQSRRIWLVIDELPSLQKIPSLDSFLARARKHGGCGVLAFQTIAQLRERYGRDGAEAIAGLCSTWMCMRQPHHETAKWVAESFGNMEVMESNQGVSYGANEIRDGVSLSHQKKIRSLLLDAEISNLPNLHGYARMPGVMRDGRSLPAVRFDFPYTSFKTIAEAFVPRALTTLNSAHAELEEVEGTYTESPFIPDLDVPETEPSYAGLIEPKPVPEMQVDPQKALDAAGTLPPMQQPLSFGTR